MKNIYLIRAAQAKPFIETATRLGAPVATLARQAELPLSDVRNGEGVIGERSLWRFIELLLLKPGYDLYGYQVALDHSVTEAGQLGGMHIEPAANLAELLNLFVQNVQTESNSASYRIETSDDGTWFRREPFSRDSSAHWQAELYVITIVIQIIRLCAPGDWLPMEIQMSSREKGNMLPPEWQSTQVTVECGETGIKLSKNVMSLPPRLKVDHNGSQSISYLGANGMMRVQDLIDRQIWGNRMGLEIAARELGMSDSSLKRSLKAIGTDYSTLLRDRRIHHSQKLLTESRLSVASIAFAMGYSAVSNFSRAFTTATGTSPRIYRKLQLERDGKV